MAILNNDSLRKVWLVWRKHLDKLRSLVLHLSLVLDHRLRVLLNKARLRQLLGGHPVNQGGLTHRYRGPKAKTSLGSGGQGHNWILASPHHLGPRASVGRARAPLMWVSGPILGHRIPGSRHKLGGAQGTIHLGHIWRRVGKVHSVGLFK